MPTDLSEDHVAGSPALPTLARYREWANETLGIVFDERAANLAETNAKTVLNEAQKTKFFENLADTLNECSQAYEQRTRGAKLLTHNPTDFTLMTKPFESMVDKSFRQNVAWNRQWPRKPRTRIGGLEIEEWVTPSNWHRTFDDLARGTLVLRYIDGPQFLADWLKQTAQAQGFVARMEPRALDDGYYAYHFYVQLSVGLLKADWSKMTDDVWVELQLTTQLQELARDLSHGFYEQRRAQPGRDQKWKWEYTSLRFKAAYVSHTLHLIEGMIVELRDGLAAAADDDPTVEAESVLADQVTTPSVDAGVDEARSESPPPKKES